MGLPIYQIEAYQKPAQSETYQLYSQISRLVPATEKILETCEKGQQNLKKILKYSNNPAALKNRSSNIPD